MNPADAFSKHIQLEHSDTFNNKLVEIFNKCLYRQVMMGLMVGATEPENRLNSKAEYIQPSVVRVGSIRRRTSFRLRP